MPAPLCPAQEWEELEEELLRVGTERGWPVPGGAKVAAWLPDLFPAAEFGFETQESLLIWDELQAPRQLPWDPVPPPQQAQQAQPAVAEEVGAAAQEVGTAAAAAASAAVPADPRALYPMRYEAARAAVRAAQPLPAFTPGLKADAEESEGSWSAPPRQKGGAGEVSSHLAELETLTQPGRGEWAAGCE